MFNLVEVFHCLFFFFRKLLFALVSKTKKPLEVTPISTSSHVNYRYLTTPEKLQRMRGLRQVNKQLIERNRRLTLKLDMAMETSSTHLDDETSEDLQKIMQEKDGNVSSKFNEDSF